MRKKLLPSCFILLAFLSGCGSPESLTTSWHRYKSLFVTHEGRVVDTGNGGISHSEGQGYGMLLATVFRDKDAFERMWRWTRANLQVRTDHLFMWRRRPPIPLAEEDPNSATDGDILIAWALLEASEIWKEEAWRKNGLAVLDDLKHSVVRSWQGKPVLLPGVAGFEKQDYLVLNLSYWVYPAFSRFAELDQDPIWQSLIRSGLDLARLARFGDWGLPPDWVEAGNTLQPWRDREPRFGYDAVRIPLYLIWGRQTDLALLTPYLKFWSGFGSFVPPWVDLQAGCLGASIAPPGIRAIRGLTRHTAGEDWWFHPPRPDKDYYSATLVLLSRLAAAGRP